METTVTAAEAGTTVKGLLATYNDRAEKAGAKPIKQWKGSKAELEKRLEALGKTETKNGKPAEKKSAKPKGEAKPRGRGIGAFCMAELAKSRNTEQVLDSVKKHFPGAKTTAACVRWYACKMRKQS